MTDGGKKGSIGDAAMHPIHTPVLLNECLSLLVPKEREGTPLFMCDSTLGEGSHTQAFLEHCPKLRVAGIDRDKDQIQRAKERLCAFQGRVEFFNTWFDDYYIDMKAEGKKADIILFDLGISMAHYAVSGRGFSFQKDEALDMRLDTQAKLSAADLVNSLREDEIANIIYDYGEERFSRRIAHKIVAARRTTKITSSALLADIVYNAVPIKYRHGRIHPATKTFQALRIAVNGELDRLKRALDAAFYCLNEGGRMGVISFHSLEDRITKQFFRAQALPSSGEPLAVLITRKGVKAGEEETKTNPPSRSASLRVIERMAHGYDEK